MILAGGAMHICSSVAPDDCRSEPAQFASARRAARYRIDAPGIERALAPKLWAQQEPALQIDAVRTLLQAARAIQGKRAFDADTLFDVLDVLCIRGTQSVPCGKRNARHPWREMLDSERNAILAALEIPLIVAGKRVSEVASLNDSARPEGVAIVRAFVAAAAKRSGGRRPLIGIVTASANDPFEPVDFYLSALREAGAEPVWWPIDAALAEAVHDSAGCDALPDLRLAKLQLPGREIVYPDLVRAQEQACRNPQALLGMVDRMQGMFFSGGDQWRLRQAFFDTRDHANPWLRKLSQAYARGDLVVAGTSAGSAVQSALGMLSNGESRNALLHGPIASAPPAPGCTRVARCPDRIDENDLTYWPAGGLALEAGFLFDTHFSERARELRLLTLMQVNNVHAALGIDETSAAHLRFVDGAVEVETLGASGAWWFEQSNAQKAQQSMRLRVHYIAPGARLIWRDNQLSVDGTPQALATAVRAPSAPTDALADGALRSVARLLASGRTSSYTLQAGSRFASLSRTETSRSWSGRQGQIGITDLILEYPVADATKAP